MMCPGESLALLRATSWQMLLLSDPAVPLSPRVLLGARRMRNALRLLNRAPVALHVRLALDSTCTEAIHKQLG
jgi:hypothetical protein